MNPNPQLKSTPPISTILGTALRLAFALLQRVYRASRLLPKRISSSGHQSFTAKLPHFSRCVYHVNKAPILWVAAWIDDGLDRPIRLAITSERYPLPTANFELFTTSNPT